MCGRISLLQADPDELADGLEADWEPEARERFRGPRYNVGPMQSHPMVRAAAAGTRRRLAWARWGVERVIGRHADGSLRMGVSFNTVAETARAKSQWRKALLERRCVVPASGFFEWIGPKKDRRPLHFTRTDGRLLLLAAVYDDPRGDEPLGFSVLTTAANRTMQPIHDRMPVILEYASVAAWLARGGDEFLCPAPEALLSSAPANPIMNRTGIDGPECLAAPPRQASGG